jgi:DNA-directed RNA polymerase subunit RPC12/RpoP
MFEHVPTLQELPITHYLCSTCDSPVAEAIEERDGSLVCRDCFRIGHAVREYVHTERLAVVRARAVLAREGAREYPGVPEMPEEQRRLRRRGERYGAAFALRYGLPREEEG